jgi:hypothetical protein
MRHIGPCHLIMFKAFGGHSSKFGRKVCWFKTIALRPTAHDAELVFLIMN